MKAFINETIKDGIPIFFNFAFEKLEDKTEKDGIGEGCRMSDVGCWMLDVGS